MGEQLLLLTTGFLLTGVLGAWLTNRFQKRAWEHQHALQQRDQERQQALKTFEEVSTLLDKRLYRMRRLYWAARSKALGASGETDMKLARAAYEDVLREWNDNLNRILALVHTYFGGGVRQELEYGIYEGFARLGRGLEVIIRIVTEGQRGPIEVPRFGHRVTQLSNSVYAVNVHMLNLVKEDRLGERAPQEPPAKRTSAVKEPPVLEIGDQGGAVRRLQRALRHQGYANLDIDGIFGRETWEAVRSFQERQPLDVDGIVGPSTWKALPSGQGMPLIRKGSQGEIVTQLQKILAAKAPSRWSVSPEATGTFDGSTSAAVKAFQRWNRLAADGVVGEQTWAAPVDESGETLQSAVESSDSSLA